jgi:hypothetical protein
MASVTPVHSSPFVHSRPASCGSVANGRMSRGSRKSAGGLRYGAVERSWNSLVTTMGAGSGTIGRCGGGRGSRGAVLTEPAECHADLPSQWRMVSGLHDDAVVSACRDGAAPGIRFGRTRQPVSAFGAAEP